MSETLRPHLRLAEPPDAQKMISSRITQRSHELNAATRHKSKVRTTQCLTRTQTRLTMRALTIVILSISTLLLHISLQGPLVAQANTAALLISSSQDTNNSLPTLRGTSIHQLSAPSSTRSNLQQVASPSSASTNGNPHNNDHPHNLPANLELHRKYVQLGNNTSSGVRNLNSNFDTYRRNHSHQQQQQQHDLVPANKKPGDSNTDLQPNQKKGLFEKICIGTSNRLSGQHNKTDHYQNLAERYRNCTYVIGNLEITWLEKSQNDNRPTDLTFLESIREITGYLLIAYVEVERIRMPNLQIIRGRDLFKLNNGEKEEFAMLLIENKLKALELPNLREILVGSVGSINNRNLCHLSTIDWNEILNPGYIIVHSYNRTLPECPPCDDACQGSCWGEGPDMCQKFSKNNCSPQCDKGRCFGSLPRECCHLFCAGGCTGPKQTDCIACKNFYDDGECIQECPSMMRYNSNKFLWETNPSGKYAFGATCVKECPDHLLRDNGACVRICPPNKRSQNGECVQCNGPCPKNCQGVDLVHSGNIEQLINCTVIEGSITILDTSFTGHTDFYTNGSIAARYPPMSPNRLRVFKTLREITGFLNIQANHSEFKNLSYFRNLQTIGGRQLIDSMDALSIVGTSLVSLNLRSLRKVRSGKISIQNNPDLCFADTIDWQRANITKREVITTFNNADSSRCHHRGLRCHSQCGRDGCWGPGSDECLSCNNYKVDDYCVEVCASTQSLGFLSYDAGGRTCKRCHSECRGGCNGTEAQDCFKCKNARDGPHCVSECPSHKYNNYGICEECDKSCVSGCTGPSNKLGEGGCNSCGKVVINSTDPMSVPNCIRAEDPCPDGFYQEYVGPQTGGPLKSSSGKPVCRKCHNRCKSCTGMGTHVSVCECAKYVAGEQCEDYCPRDYFADEQSRHCVRCSPECNGCFGPTEADCTNCRVYRIYHDSYMPLASAQVSGARVAAQTPDGPAAINNRQLRFNCTAQCPPDKPHRISESNMLDPYCSEDPGLDPDNPRISSLGSASIMFILISSAAIMFCISVYRCQIEKDKTVKLTMHLSGIDDVEPLNPSNLKPNLAPLRSIKDTELRKGDLIGKGYGGSVYQGYWKPEDGKKGRPVAIKVLRDNGQSNSNKEFLDEAYIMASVNHPNVVRLLAICMTQDHLMLVTQLMPLGCLLDYVRSYKNDIGSKNLFEWCKQIARGMAYLEEQRMVHRDLALRNVLLQTPGKAMISDFGLAKYLEADQSEYHAKQGRSMPIKWLAPECLSESKYTHQSDVWSFGVTIWELLTFGKIPYEGLELKDVREFIERGERLKQPEYMTAEVYKVMCECWFPNPKDRPDFNSLTRTFVNFARDPERYLDGEIMRREIGRGSNGGDEKICNLFSSESDSCFEEDVQQINMPNLRDLTPTGRERINTFDFELRHHHSQETTNAIQLSTPTFKKTNDQLFYANGDRQFEEDVFSRLNQRPHSNLKQPTSGLPSDMNNNNGNGSNNGPFCTSSRFNSNTESCSSVHHTVSTNSLGQKSEQPTDLDDYLLPSPLSKEDKFNKFLASREGPSTKLPPVPSFSRDPPHSAGLIGISNDEYFLTRTNYGSHGQHSTTNASSGHIPHSLV